MHEMGEMKRPQELRTDVVSVQKLRENHETVQQLTSQLQQMQEQNSMNDSGDFQDVESNFHGRLYHVSSQACNDSEISFFAQPRQTPASWHMESNLDCRKMFFGNQFLRLIHPEIVIKGIPSFYYV